MKGSAIILDGYLLKKKKDSDGKKFVAQKYQRRWFELTSETLTYAKSPKDLRNHEGKIEVFAIHELQFITLVDNSKLEIKFPERLLKVKGENPGDLEKWNEAIEQAATAKNNAQSSSQQRNLEAIKKVQKHLLNDKGDYDEEEFDRRSQDLVRPPTPPRKASGSRQSEEVPGPPSPRSLLANPRMASNFIQAPQRHELDSDTADSPDSRGPVSRWQDEMSPDSRLPPSRWQDEESPDARRLPPSRWQDESSPGAPGPLPTTLSGSAPPPQRTLSQKQLQPHSEERLVLDPAPILQSPPTKSTRHDSEPDSEVLVLQPDPIPVVPQLSAPPQRLTSNDSRAKQKVSEPSDDEVLVLNEGNGVSVKMPTSPMIPKEYLVMTNSTSYPHNEDEDGEQVSRRNIVRVSSGIVPAAVASAVSTEKKEWLEDGWDSDDESHAEPLASPAASPSPRTPPQPAEDAATSPALRPQAKSRLAAASTPSNRTSLDTDDARPQVVRTAEAGDKSWLHDNFDSDGEDEAPSTPAVVAKATARVSGSGRQIDDSDKPGIAAHSGRSPVSASGQAGARTSGSGANASAGSRVPASAAKSSSTSSRIPSAGVRSSTASPKAGGIPSAPKSPAVKSTEKSKLKSTAAAPTPPPAPANDWVNEDFDD